MKVVSILSHAISDRFDQSETVGVSHTNTACDIVWLIMDCASMDGAGACSEDQPNLLKVRMMSGTVVELVLEAFGCVLFQLSFRSL